MSDHQEITVGVTFTPIVQMSTQQGQINEPIHLILISGLNYYDIKWESSEHIVETNPDSTIVFQFPGLYKPRVMGHLLEVSQYWITIN